MYRETHEHHEILRPKPYLTCSANIFTLATLQPRSHRSCTIDGGTRIRSTSLSVERSHPGYSPRRGRHHDVARRQANRSRSVTLVLVDGFYIRLGLINWPRYLDLSWGRHNRCVDCPHPSRDRLVPTGTLIAFVC